MDKDLVKLFRESKETPDAMLYRLRFAPPEKLDTLYNGTLHILRLSGKAVRVYAIHTEDSAAAMEWIWFIAKNMFPNWEHISENAGRGQAFTKRREDIRKMSAADRGRAVHGLAKTMHTHATLSPRVTFDPSRVDWWALALTVVYGKFPPFQATAHCTPLFEAYTVDR